MVLAALSAVDMVVLFDDETPVNLIKEFAPTFLFKGDDYTHAKIAGADIVGANGGRVVIIPRISGYSTTSVIDKIKQPELVVNKH